METMTKPLEIKVKGSERDVQVFLTMFVLIKSRFNAVTAKKESTIKRR